MTELHPDEVYRARFHAEIQRVKKQHERFSDGKLRLFEEREGSDGMVDITAAYIDELEAHLEELQFFLSKVKEE